MLQLKGHWLRFTKMILKGCFLFSLILPVSIYGQDTLRVRVAANVRKDAIQLRWAVNSPMAWKQANKYGFRIERFTVVRNNVILRQPEKLILTPHPLKPQPLDQWENLAKSNTYAAIIAQALYGEKFQLTGDDAKGVSQFFALAQELEQRYLVSTYAADLCYPAALLAGWGFEDRTVKPDERYLYRVISLIPEKTLRVEYGSVYASVGEYQPLPQPQELIGVFGDRSAMLTWNYGALGHLYNAYFVEKSTDGKLFHRISDIPLTNMNARDGKPLDRMYYLDSLRDNNTETYYRVVGITAFSEEGPPSEIIHGKGKVKLIYVPNIERAIPNDKGGVKIEWVFDPLGNNMITHFELRRGDGHNGPFKTLLKNISPKQREVVYDTLHSSNYFVIAAVPEQGEPTISFPVLVQPSDTIPPAVPAGLQGIIDTLGVVHITWESNTDHDILGYRVYRGQTDGEELIPLNDVAVRTSAYTDTIDVRNLNSKVYYAVTALDHRYNQSEKSDVVMIRKPDLVPPSPPLISDLKATANGVFIEWLTGDEESISAIHVIRQEKGLDEHKVIKVLDDPQRKNFTDETTESGKTYRYMVKAVTQGGLESKPSPAMTIVALARVAELGKIEMFEGNRSRKDNAIELSWRHNLKAVKEFQVYKGQAGKPVSLWKVVKGFEVSVQDKDVLPGAQYEYILQAVLENGKNGAIAKVSVKN